MLQKHKEGVPEDMYKQVLNSLNMSIINWQTGVPKKTGTYIVTVQGGEVFQSKFTYFYRDKCCYFVNDYGNPILERVLAWCPLSEIEPYKE